MVPSLHSFNLSGQIRQSRPLPMAWTARGAGSRSRAARRPSSGRIPSSTRRSRRRRAAPEPPRACSAPLLPPPSEPPHGVDGVKLLRCVPRPRPLRRPATGSKLQPPHHLLSSPAPISSSPFPSSRNLLSPPGFLPAAPLSPPDPAAGQRLSSNPAPQGLFYVHQGTIKADTMADAPAGDAGEAEMDPMLDPTRKPLRSNDQVQVAASATATTCPKPSSGTANKRSKTAVHLDGAALFLNQGKFYPIMKRGDDELVGELRGCFNDVLGKMIEDEEIQNKIDQQAVLYENQRGPFSNVMAMQNIGTRNPHCFGEKKREEQVGMQSVLLGQPPGFIARAYRLVLLGDESALAATAEEARSCAAGGAAAVAVVGLDLAACDEAAVGAAVDAAWRCFGDGGLDALFNCCSYEVQYRMSLPMCRRINLDELIHPSTNGFGVFLSVTVDLDFYIDYI